MTTVVNPSTDSGAGAALGVVLAVLLIAVIGYMIYAFSGGSAPAVIERNTTIERNIQVPIEVPKAPALPEAPSGE